MGRCIYFSIVLVCILYECTICQVTYRTIQDGNWNSPSSWASGIPPNPLPIGDSIIIQHGLNYNINQVILGVLLIDSVGSVNSGGTDNLSVGRGGIGVGELINYGSLTISDLEVKPNNGCTANLLGLPTVNNFGVIKTTNSLHIGNDCGAGSFYNQVGGKVFVANEIHLDNYLCNSDSIYIGNFIKIDGGTVDCCGYIEVSLLDIDANPTTSRASNLNCIIFCGTGGVASIIDIGGIVYPTLNSAYLNADPGEAMIDDDSTFICDFNQAGMPNSLPIELVRFEGMVQDETMVVLNWQTSSEVNNHYYTIERSVDGINWEKVGEVLGKGTTTNLTHYTFLDKDPFAGVSYYRLKQTDFDLSFSYSNIITIKLPELRTRIAFYPNPVDEEVVIRGKIGELENLELYSMQGQKIVSSLEIKEHRNYYTKIDVSNLPSGFYILKIENTAVRIQKN